MALSELSAYLPILIQIILAVGICIGLLVASHITGQRGNRTPIKDSPYECGLLAEGKTHPRFSVKFYVVAMLFIIFDIEVVFLYPWVQIFREFVASGVPVLGPALFFLGILFIGLIYEIKKGALEWER